MPQVVAYFVMALLCRFVIHEDIGASKLLQVIAYLEVEPEVFPEHDAVSYTQVPQPSVVEPLIAGSFLPHAPCDGFAGAYGWSITEVGEGVKAWYFFQWRVTEGGIYGQ